MMNVAILFSRICRTSHTSHQQLLKRIQIKCVKRNLSDVPPTINNTPNDQKHEEQDDKRYDDNIKTKILAASMPFVIELGWSRETLVAGAEKVGYPGVTHGLFPQGAADLIQYFNSDCNKKLATHLKKTTEENSKVIPKEYVKNAIETRLRMNIPYMPRWPQAIAIMTLPSNVPHTLATILTLADDICYYAGDRSVDFTWYSRRIAIAGMYKATELYMVQDKSEDYKQTWDFLVRRLDELFQIHDILNQSEVVGAQAKEAISATFITARNIMGFNWNR